MKVDIPLNKETKPKKSFMADMLDCCLVLSKFELQSCYYVHFWTNILCKGMNSLVRQWPGRPGFNPRLSHTKDSKMVLDVT